VNDIYYLVVLELEQQLSLLNLEDYGKLFYYIFSGQQVLLAQTLHFFANM